MKWNAWALTHVLNNIQWILLLSDVVHLCVLCQFNEHEKSMCPRRWIGDPYFKFDKHGPLIEWTRKSTQWQEHICCQSLFPKTFENALTCLLCLTEYALLHSSLSCNPPLITTLQHYNTQHYISTTLQPWNTARFPPLTTTLHHTLQLPCAGLCILYILWATCTR